MRNPLGAQLSSYSMMEDNFSVDGLLEEALTDKPTLTEAAPSFNRHQMLMSPGTRELVLKSRMTEIEAFARDRGLDPAMVGAIAEAAMRTGRVPDMRQYGIDPDEAKAVKHFISGDILNLAIEDIERMKLELEEGFGKRASGLAKRFGHEIRSRSHGKAQAQGFDKSRGKTCPSGTKMVFGRCVSVKKKSAVSSFGRRGKPVRTSDVNFVFDKEQGFVTEGRSSPETMQKFYDIMDQNSAVLARLQDDPGKLTKRLIMFAKQAGMTPMQALGPAVIHAAKYVKQGKIKRRMVAKEATNSKESAMLGPDPLNESTVSSGMGANPLGLGSAFIERPRALFSINQWEKNKEEQQAINADPWIGVDMEHQSGYTLDQILAMDNDQTEVTESSNPRPTLARRLEEDHHANCKGGVSPENKAKAKAKAKAKKDVEEGTGLEGGGKKGTALAKALKTSKKKITSPAEDPPGDFDTANGGTSSGDTDTNGRLKEMTFSKEHGFVFEMKHGEMTKKEKSPKNKAKWAGMSPEQKKNWGAATKSKPFHKA